MAAPIHLVHYQRRRALRLAAVSVGIRPDEHPSSTLRRDGAGAAPSFPGPNDPHWQCPRCGRRMSHTAPICTGCGYMIARNGGTR